MKKSLFALGFLAAAFGANSQNVLSDKVYTILNTKCQNSTCHSASSTDFPKFDGTKAQVLAAITNVNSQNSTAQAAGDHLVRSGHPYRSFLLNKIGHPMNDSYLALDANGGSPMNDINGSPLSKNEVEYIRQWIMFGCQTGTTNYDNTVISTVDDYYSNPIYPYLPVPQAPPVGQGLQVRCGPIFLPKTGNFQEQEWVLANEVEFPYNPEVTAIQGIMNQQSHHFLLFKFSDSTKAFSRGDGLKLVSISSGMSSFDGDKDLTGAWQDDADINLPTGTALFWPKKTYLDLNYHVKNYANDGSLPCDFYLNVLFRPRQATTIEMKSALVNNVALFLPQGNQTQFYNDQDNGNNETRYIWLLSSHTHKFGTDYDIHERDPAMPNQLGPKIYEGFYSYEQGFDRGYYDWEHPSIKYFDPIYPVDMRKGIRARTTWNVTQQFVTFGFTTNDEMQLFYYMYTNENPNPSSVKEVNEIKTSVAPNPFGSKTSFMYELKSGAQVRASISDISGRVVAEMKEGREESGTHQIEIDANEWNLGNGIYFMNLHVDGKPYSHKLVVNR
jgi:hypothetical protein